MRLIDADSLIDYLRKYKGTFDYVSVAHIIRKFPTVERPKGKWIDTEPILDKIRAEIQDIFPQSGIWMYGEGGELEHTVCETLVDVLKIIDKYKAEMEGVAKNATTTEEGEE